MLFYTGPQSRAKVMNMGLLHSVQPKDLEFLANLDKKLRTWHHFSDDGGVYKGWTGEYDFNELKIGEDEVKEVIEACKRNDLVFYPHNTNMGFSPGYFVAKNLHLPASRTQGLLEKIKKNTCQDITLDAFKTSLTWNETLLGMIERQMPAGYDGAEGFKRLSEYFMSEKNLRLAKAAGIEIVNDYTRHQY